MRRRSGLIAFGAAWAISWPAKLISPCVRTMDAHDEPRQRGLAAARFADQPDRLAAPDIEVDAVDRVDEARRLEEAALRQAEMLDDATQPEKRRGVRGDRHARRSNRGGWNAIERLLR